MATTRSVDISHLVDISNFGGIHGIRFDFFSALELVNFLLDAYKPNTFPNPTVIDAFSSAIAVRYARPFMSGVRDTRHQDEIKKSMTAKEMELHEYLMGIRNRHVAHSVSFLEESRVVAQYWVEKVHEEGFVHVSVEHERMLGFGTNELTKIKVHLEALLPRVEQRILDEEKKFLLKPESLSVPELLPNGREAERKKPADRT